MKLNQIALKQESRAARSRSRAGSLLLSVAIVAIAGLGMLSGVLIADGEGEMSPSGGGAGGDTVGSLPHLLLPPGSGGGGGGGGSGLLSSGDPETPILTLTGPVTDVLEMIADAYGEGGVYIAWLGEGNARFEFYGHDTVILDRTRFQNSFVKAQIMIGSSFQGALLKVSVGNVVRATHALTAGTVDTRLRKMSQTGLIDQGVTWHAENAEHVHSVLSFKGSGNLIKIEQRD